MTIEQKAIGLILFGLLLIGISAVTAVSVIADVYMIDANDVITVDGSYIHTPPKPTHRCAKHGDLGGQYNFTDFTTITVDEVVIYDGCSRCTMEHLAVYLKRNIPPITKIKEGVLVEPCKHRIVTSCAVYHMGGECEGGCNECIECGKKW